MASRSQRKLSHCYKLLLENRKRIKAQKKRMLNRNQKKRKKKDNLKSLNRVKNHNWRKKRLLLKKTEIR